MSTTCQPGLTLGPVIGSRTGEKVLVDALNSSAVVPLCQVTALVASTGSTSTASSSPACGHCAPFVSQNPHQLAISPLCAGSAGKSMSASITAEEYRPGLISPTQLPAWLVVVSPTVPSPPAATAPLPTIPEVCGQ